MKLPLFLMAFWSVMTSPLRIWLGFLLFACMLSAAVPSRTPASASTTGSDENQMHIQTINTRDTPLTIAELEQLCGVPGACGRPLACEGQWAWVQGQIDHDNVFDHARYPQLDYEKFFLVTSGESQKLDVFVECKDGKAIFDALHDHAKASGTVVLVQGRIVGFDMPTMGQCRRGISLVLADPGGIVFQESGAKSHFAPDRRQKTDDR
jgi:hypothetical protein